AQVILMLKFLPSTPEAMTIRHQLSKASTSGGANYEESQAGSSRADFSNKIRISLREVKESNYWLRLIQRCQLIQNEQSKTKLKFLIEESSELTKILASILNKCRS
ncbi:MAG: four helix bundle protein, partial [Bacteroidales bacterium]